MRDISSPLDGIASPFGQQRTKTLAQLLFASSEPGFTFEPWDITTLYQDRAGTTPVTAAGQSVGLRLDKSQGLRLGAELVTNGDFSAGTTGWTLGVGVTITGGSATFTSAAGGNGVSQSTSIPSGNYKISFQISNWVSGGLILRLRNAGGTIFNSFATANSAGNGIFTAILNVSASFNQIEVISPGGAGSPSTFTLDNISVREFAGNHQVAVSDAKRGVYGWMPKTGRRNLMNATDTLSTQSVTVTAVAHTLAFTGTGTVTLSGVSTAGPLVGTGAGNRVTLTFTPTAGSLTLTVSGSVTLSQLEIGSSATAYQRVVSQYDITEAGVPTCYYVQADGVDDAYVTPTITPGTDKAQVFAGMRKLSDAAAAVFMEYSASWIGNIGALIFTAPGTTAPSGNYDSASRGNIAFNANQGASTGTISAPVTNVITATHDIAGDLTVIRSNGSQLGTATGDKGTGNFLAYPAYIYGRGGTSLPFNGLDFGHAVRFGPNLDAATIARVEALIARNTPEVTL